MNISNFGSFVLSILLIIGVFLLFREFWCWYWKINERNDLLRNIRDSIDKMRFSDKTKSVKSSSKSELVNKAKEAFGDSWLCGCGARCSNAYHVCMTCGKNR